MRRAPPQYTLRAIVPHRVHRPGILDDEKRYPLRLAHSEENPASDHERDSIHDEKGDIESLFVLRRLEIVGNVEQEAL